MADEPIRVGPCEHGNYGVIDCPECRANARHAPAFRDGPDLAVRVVAAIEADLQNREGLSWDNLADDALIQALRDELAEVVRRVLSGDAPRKE